jgi:DNA-binding GntR family transcriptional regulator
MAKDLKQRAYLYLRRQLLDGELRAGTAISPYAVAREMGISHTPVREALGRLESEGLIQHVPRLGPQVRQLGQADLDELFDLRRVLECGAVELASERASPGQLNEMKDLCRQYGEKAREARDQGLQHYGGPLIEAMDQIDLQLHTSIVAAAGSRRLVKLLSDLSLLRRVFQHGHERDVSGITVLERVERIHHDHSRVVEALCNRDAATAREAMARHIEHGRELHLRLFLHQASQEGSPLDDLYGVEPAGESGL